MMKIEIRNRHTDKIMLSGKYDSIKDCLEKNRGADLGGAYLRDAYLEGAYLRGADLGGAKNYVDSHDIFKEIIRRQPVKTFTNPEWSIIGQILVHTLCWDSIKKRYGKKIMPLFKKLSELGFDEWEKYYTLKEKE